jgi:hypothetical protein
MSSLLLFDDDDDGGGECNLVDDYATMLMIATVAAMMLVY